MYLGIEIGGTNLRVGVGDGRTGRLAELIRAPVDRAAGARGIRATLARLVPPLLARHQVRGIGIGFGGPVDAPRGRVVKSHHIAGWSGFDLRRWSEARFGLPTAVENDTHLAGLAEARVGAGRGRGRVFYFNVGTGIGGALILDGAICQGRYGGAELGHTRIASAGGAWGGDLGRTGVRPSRENCPILEELASGLAIERGRSTVGQAASWVAVAVANLIALVNPEVIVVGGGVAGAGTAFFRPLRATVARLVFAPYRTNYRIVPSALGEAVVVAGAVLWAGEAAKRARAGRDSPKR